MKLELIRYVLLYLEALHTGPEYKRLWLVRDVCSGELVISLDPPAPNDNLVLTDLCHPLNDSEVESKLLEATFDEVKRNLRSIVKDAIDHVDRQIERGGTEKSMSPSDYALSRMLRHARFYYCGVFQRWTTVSELVSLFAGPNTLHSDFHELEVLFETACACDFDSTGYHLDLLQQA